MNLMACPDLAAALAVERYGRFVAEAESSRRMSQLRGGNNGPLAPRFVAAVRRRLVTRTARSTKGDTMDQETFDSVSRSLADGLTRRRFSGALAAIGLGSIASLRLPGTATADGKGRKNGKEKKKVTICRKGQTIRVAKRALKKQLRRGATRGACPTTEEQPQCVPDCTGPLGPKACGDDGCGGTCGTCPTLLPICHPITFTCEPIVVLP